MALKKGTKRPSDNGKANKMHKPSKKNEQPWMLSMSLMTIVLGAVLATGIQIYNLNTDRDQATMKALHFVCRAEGGYCHNGLQAFQRSHRAKHIITKGTILVKIPRSLQIWDLDALRALDINRKIRNDLTGRPLDGGAYLAFYLWERFVHRYEKDDPLLPYYHSFPTNLSNHPIFWSDAQLQNRLRRHSHAYAVARAYRDMVQSEYNALVKLQPDLPLETYQGFRILVLSRSFGTGPPGHDETIDSMSLDRELVSYNKTLGVDLTRGCRAMVPILDMYNHHGISPNVEWRYDKRAFIITASRQIGIHQILYDSYGTYTDSHLFAKFGFQNGDGSARTDASIAAMHRLMDVGLQQQFTYLPSKAKEYAKLMDNQKIVLARYLQFDDGYSTCIIDPSSIPYQLKQLKLQHLMRLAHDPKRWIFSIPPRNPRTSPHDDLPDKSPAFNMKALPSFDASKVISTCRLMVLIEEDFHGNAIHVLQEHIQNERDAILIDKQSDPLEYRALLCLSRLAGLVLHAFDISPGPHSVQTFADSVRAEIHSPTWTTHQVVVGELQTLEVLSKVAAAGAHRHASKIPGELPTIRRLPCDWKDTKRLAEHTSYR